MVVAPKGTPISTPSAHGRPLGQILHCQRGGPDTVTRGGGNPSLRCAPSVLRWGRGSPMIAVPSAACSELYPMEENLYEPLDPPITAPSRKHSPDPPGTAWVSHRDVAMQPKLGSCGPHQDPLSPPSVSPARQSCPQDRLLLVGAVALGVSVLLNVFLLSLGTRQSEYGVCGAQQGGPQPWGMTLGHRWGSGGSP